MREEGNPPATRRPGAVDHAISALNAWIGDHLQQSENELQQEMAFYRELQPVAPEDLTAPATGKACVLVHGLACNESTWTFAARHDGGDYGALLERDCGYTPLYLRYNTGLRISNNGENLAGLLQRFCSHHGDAVQELLLIGHSLGGLVIRSACHFGTEAAHPWVQRVRHVIYLGSPHLGAPLEKVANAASHILGRFDSTATRVLRDLLNTRSAGVKDLRYGNLTEADWREHDADELLTNRRVPVPWLATARHHRVIGQVVPGVAALGDAMVPAGSAAGSLSEQMPGAPDGPDLRVVEGLDHLSLAHHPAVYEHIESWVTQDG